MENDKPSIKPDWHSCFDDPPLIDENDPEFQHELFETFRALGWHPNDLFELTARDKYADWLHNQGLTVFGQEIVGDL